MSYKGVEGILHKRSLGIDPFFELRLPLRGGMMPLQRATLVVASFGTSDSKGFGRINCRGVGDPKMNEREDSSST